MVITHEIETGDRCLMFTDNCTELIKNNNRSCIVNMRQKVNPFFSLSAVSARVQNMMDAFTMIKQRAANSASNMKTNKLRT